MKVAFAILASLLLGANLANTQESSPEVLAPDEQSMNFGIHPAIEIVSSTDKAKGVIWIHNGIFKCVPVMKEVEVNKDGTPVKVQVSVLVLKYHAYKTPIDVNKCKFITPDGKELPMNAVWKRLQPKSVVVVSGDGLQPDRAFLKVLQADTVVIIWNRAPRLPPPLANTPDGLLPAPVPVPPATQRGHPDP